MSAVLDTVQIANRGPVRIDRTRDELLTQFGMDTLTDRYLLAGESFQDLFARVASAYGDDQGHAQRIYDYMSKLWFMPATPVLSNGGTQRGLPISCFLNECEDSLQSIVGLWNENVWLASKGGGIGSYWGNLRSIGESVGGVGKTSGIVPFVRVMDSLTLAISQGSLRRGSAAVYLPVSHPEIEEFIEIRRPTGGDPNRKAPNLHHGIVVPDAFMRAVEADELWPLVSPKDGSVVKSITARSLWIRILTARIETGEPYLIFSDHVNRAMPEHHKLAGLSVKTSNLCVAPDTMVLTNRGYFQIKDLAGQTVKVWNGHRWSDAPVAKTGENQPLIRVLLSDGSHLDCTPYHKFYVQEDYHLKPEERRAIDLRRGDKLSKFEMPLVTTGESWGDPYINGFFSADGTYDHNKRPLIWLYDAKRALAPYLFTLMNSYKQNAGASNRDALVYPQGALWPKFTVPENCDLPTKLQWLAGLCDGDGTIARNGDNQSLQISSTNTNFLSAIRRMLHGLGVQGKIALMHEARAAMMPDGHGAQKAYDCEPVWRLLVTSIDLQRLLYLGFDPKRLKLDYHQPQRNARQFVQVVDIEDTGRRDDTYCFNEPMRHMGVFNGILTGNCSEITLPTGIDQHGQDRTAVCCLSSLNLEYWMEWKDHPTFIEDVMRFLDNVLQDFIDRAPAEMAKAKYSAMRERSVGLGVMGFHSFLQSQNVPWESVIAKSWNRKMFKHIREQADLASRVLADERGPCPDAAEYGFMERFSCKMSLAPTASISIICGGSSPGIEPIAANVFLQKTLSGSHAVRNRHLKKLLAEKGHDTDEVWSSITTNKGSVQNLEFLTEQEKMVYRTAFELDQRWVIEHAADRAPFICQSQSVNLFLPANIHKRDLHQIHMMAWKKNVKSLYYARSLSIQRADNVSEKVQARAAPMYDNSECLSCQ